MGSDKSVARDALSHETPVGSGGAAEKRLRRFQARHNKSRDQTLRAAAPSQSQTTKKNEARREPTQVRRRIGFGTIKAVPRPAREPTAWDLAPPALPTAFPQGLPLRCHVVSKLPTRLYVIGAPGERQFRGAINRTSFVHREDFEALQPGSELTVLVYTVNERGTVLLTPATGGRPLPTAEDVQAEAPRAALSQA
jgi:hypothetical protein